MTTTPASARSPTDEKFDELWKRRCEQLNWAHITYRYHRKRQRFFDIVDKLTQVVAVGGGVAVAGKTLTDHMPLVGGVIAFAGLLTLVFGYGDKRQCHKELAELSIQMAGAIESMPAVDMTEASVCDWERMRTNISLREPASLKTLVDKCEWEQAVAEGHLNHKTRPKWYQEAHMHFF